MKKPLTIFASVLLSIAVFGLAATHPSRADETSAVVYWKISLGGPTKAHSRSASKPTFGVRVEQDYGAPFDFADGWSLPPLLDMKFNGGGLRTARVVGFDTVPSLRALGADVVDETEAEDADSQTDQLSQPLIFGLVAVAVVGVGFAVHEALDDDDPPVSSSSSSSSSGS